jgi:hypothetical protein
MVKGKDEYTEMIRFERNGSFSFCLMRWIQDITVRDVTDLVKGNCKEKDLIII